MKTNLSQLEKTSSNAAVTTPNSALQDNLRSLRLTYVLENAVQAAEQAAGNGKGHLQYLEALIAGEVALRHDRSVQRRIHDARFPVTKTMAGWDWNWPTKINRMQVEHLLQLDFIDTCTNVIFAGPTGTGTMPGTGLCRVTWHFPSNDRLFGPAYSGGPVEVISHSRGSEFTICAL